MATEKSNLQSFTQSWQKYAAWAQTQGIKYNSYYPVYQMDANRMLSGETPMSTSEVTRAILAAANPKNVTPTPTDKPKVNSPSSFFGAAVNDFRNIFTGLAPNHLVSSVVDTAKNTLIHPATWIKPLEDVAGGAVTGNWGEVKSGLELASGVTGPGSILSWLPGVYVAGEFAQGGVNEVLSHPVQSFLDVAPFAPAGRIIGWAADESRAASIADRLGTTPEKLRDASAPGLAKSFIMTRKITEDTPLIGSRMKYLLDPEGNQITVGGALSSWVQHSTGLGKTISALSAAIIDHGDVGTDREAALIRPVEQAVGALSAEQKTELNNLITRTDPRARGKDEGQIMADSTIDPAVRTAFKLKDAYRQWINDEAFAQDAAVAVQRSDGTTVVLHTEGAAPPVLKAHQDLVDAQNNLVTAMEPAHRIVNEIASWDKEAKGLVNQMGQDTQQAAQVAEKLDGTTKVEVDRVKGKPRYVHLNLRKEADALFGQGKLIDHIEQAAKDQEWAQMKALAGAAERRLSRSDQPGAVSAEIDPTFAKVLADVTALKDYAAKRLEYERNFDKLLTSDDSKRFKSQFTKYMKARRDFDQAVWDHPSAEWIPTVEDLFVKRLMEVEDFTSATSKAVANLRSMKTAGGKRTYSDEMISKLRADPQRLTEMIIQETRAAMTNPMGDQIIDPEVEKALWSSAIDETNRLRQEGHEVFYIPHVSGLKINDEDPGRYGIHVSPTGNVRRSSRAFERKVGFHAQVRDVDAALHVAAKEALQRDATIDFVEHDLQPHMMSAGQVYQWVKMNFPNEFVGAAGDPKNLAALIEDKATKNFGLVKWDPSGKFGFSLPRWGNEAQYLPKALANSLDKFLDKGQFPMDAWYDKATKLFRFSILKLSPRYTAHITFGGSFLLALRSSPRVLDPRLWGDAYRMIKDGSEINRRIGIGSAATQFGFAPVEYRSFSEADKLRNAGSSAFHTHTGSDQARLVAQEELAKTGIDWRKANPLQWLKAVGDINYRFTNNVVDWQRSVAFLDHYAKGIKKFKDPVSGEVTSVTRERALEQGVQHALSVMGNLKAMTPLERSINKNIMPFYGWTKHVLSYVLTYPVDHPYRAQFLTTLAEQNSADVASGLYTRIQFLFYLGSPDKQGNVSAVNLDFMDPLRDVANYASFGGWVSALNPIISAPLAMMNPDSIFGGQSTYPNVSYDQFYGIEVAGTQGSPLNAIEAVVPQVTALDAALGLSAQYRQEAKSDPGGFAKRIYESLNIPFAQVQHLNLKQIAAQDEIDRYHVASQMASNAFQTGDFSSLQGLSSVPDPENAEYEVTPSYLQQLYSSLLAQYPGQQPSETATPPPPISV